MTHVRKEGAIFEIQKGIKEGALSSNPTSVFGSTPPHRIFVVVPSVIEFKEPGPYPLKLATDTQHSTIASHQLARLISTPSLHTKYQ
jgi:hypothetical protein